jgi:hypothetical protein
MVGITFKLDQPEWNTKIEEYFKNYPDDAMIELLNKYPGMVQVYINQPMTKTLWNQHVFHNHSEFVVQHIGKWLHSDPDRYHGKNIVFIDVSDGGVLPLSVAPIMSVTLATDRNTYGLIRMILSMIYNDIYYPIALTYTNTKCDIICFNGCFHQKTQAEENLSLAKAALEQGKEVLIVSNSLINKFNPYVKLEPHEYEVLAEWNIYEQTRKVLRLVKSN